MDREYFEEYYHLERNHWWFKVRALILNQHIGKYFSKNQNIKILNIGVATGATTDFLSKYGKVISVEYDQICSIETYKKIQKPIVNGSITKLPFGDNLFDLVCAFDVIEHVENDQLAVDEMVRACKDRGMICVTVPAYMFLWSKHDVVNNHFRRYSAQSLKNLFNKNAGRILYSSYFNSILFPAVAFFRLISGFLPEKSIRKGAGSDFSVFNQDSFINNVFYKIFYLELILLKKFKFLFGTSLLLSWIKKEKD